MKSRVALLREADIEQGIHQALDQLAGFEELVRGRHVAVKPNETWASEDDLTACTQADSVAAVIRYVKRFEPKAITVTGGAGAGETDEIFRLLGMDKVIEEEGVAFRDHNRPPFREVHLEHGPHRDIMVNEGVFEYDTLISLAQCKVHSTATVTLSMKNIAMSYPAADYYGHPRSEQVHPQSFFEDMHGHIAGMCRRFPIDLAIISGHPAMIEKGPIGGKAFESELTVASRDCVAADAVGAYLLGKESVRHIELAAELGLGAARLDEIEVVGLSLEEARKLFWEKASAT